MNLKKADAVAQVVTLPRRFHNLGNASILSLLEATGYFRLHDLISEADIQAALVRSPEYIREWMQYSEDKRTSGWYFTRNDEDCYEVGYTTECGNCQQRVVYDKETDACAKFVKHEIDDIRLAACARKERNRGSK